MINIPRSFQPGNPKDPSFSPRIFVRTFVLSAWGSLSLPMFVFQHVTNLNQWSLYHGSKRLIFSLSCLLSFPDMHSFDWQPGKLKNATGVIKVEIMSALGSSAS